VPPLAPPQPGASFDEIVRSEAVELLNERTRAVNRACALTESSAPAFADICRRLDGLPLALELAASRMRTLAPEAVAAGLSRALELLVDGPRDLPARHHTLRATLDWSYQQLDAAQQLLFAQLAAFAGAFDADDVAAVCGAQSAAPLASLVEINLVRQLEPGCFTMLQTIREYAAECLERSGENTAARTRHCRHVLEVTERAHDAILAADEAVAAYAALERVHDNLREALSWAAQAGEVELEVRLACAARQFWLVRGHLAEGRAFFERAVLATEGADPRLRAQALMNGGPFLYRQGELALARAWWEEALGILEEQQDVAGVSRCAGELGAVAFSEGDLDSSATWYERAANGFAALDDRMRLGIVRANQAEIAALQGDMVGAAADAGEAVAIAREAGDLDSLAIGLHTLGRLAMNAGETGRARQLFGECLIGARDIGYREAVANCVQAAAELTLIEDRDPELAARLQVIARHTLEQMGVRLQGLEAESFARTAGSLSAHLGDERLCAIANDTDGESLESVVEVALELLARDVSLRE
jgi:non-specific serine/threonine protein kinase